MRCLNCRIYNENDAVYCKSCGSIMATGERVVDFVSCDNCRFMKEVCENTLSIRKGDFVTYCGNFEKRGANSGTSPAQVRRKIR